MPQTVSQSQQTGAQPSISSLGKFQISRYLKPQFDDLYDSVIYLLTLDKNFYLMYITYCQKSCLIN